MALADVLVNQVHTFATVLTRIAVALVELVLTTVACVARVTVACVACDAVYARAVVTRVRLTIVDVALTESSFIA